MFREFKKKVPLFPYSKLKETNKSTLQLRTTGESYKTLAHSSYKDQKKNNPILRTPSPANKPITLLKHYTSIATALLN